MKSTAKRLTGVNHRFKVGDIIKGKNQFLCLVTNTNIKGRMFQVETLIIYVPEKFGTEHRTGQRFLINPTANWSKVA